MNNTGPSLASDDDVSVSDEVEEISDDAQPPVKKQRGLGRVVYADQWTLQEKIKLLDGLKRFNEHPESISKWIETKSSRQVELMIEELREHGQYRKPAACGENAQEDDSQIDKWCKLIRVMTYYEQNDYSELIPMVFAMIARIEEFTPSCSKKLDWKKIYQYLATLLEGRSVMPELTNIESCIVLDLMDSMGHSMQQLDTAHQKQILDFKYQLLTAHRGMTDQQSKAMTSYRNTQALSNDFWDLEEATTSKDSRSCVTEARNSTITAQTDDSSLPQNDLACPPPLSLTNNTTTNSRSSTTTTTPNPDTNTNDDSDNVITSTEETPQDQPSHVTSEQLDSTGALLSPPQQPQMSTYEALTSIEERFRQLKHKIQTDQENPTGKTFKKPMYFTLNPLCIPSSLMSLKKKRRKGLKRTE